MPTPSFASEIRKTGFVLENEVAQVLKASGWTVISNKYYVDDSEDTVREIDLVAYRVARVEHFDVYTVLIVSCKKSDANVWALLAREINLKDPNSDWWPLHAWSNDKALSFQLSSAGGPKAYHEAALRSGVVEALKLPAVEVFAFQEMDKVSGKPQNDKPIFSAVTSLMKAQAYELSALPGRKKTPSVYQFNLLSVVDTELVRLMFSGSEISQSEVDTEHYLARYIIRKREMFARVRFVRAQAFAAELEDYGRLHQANCKWFASECETFYSGILQDWHRSDTLLDDFAKKFRFQVAWRLQDQFKREFDLGKPALYWDKSSNAPRIGFPRERWEQLTRPSFNHLIEVIADTQKRYQEHWRSVLLPGIRVFCVSEERDNLLMWAQYARDHAGCVFELWSLPDEDNPLSVAMPVDYAEAPPPFFTEQEWLDDLMGIKNLDIHALYRRYAYVKSDHWAYEREWRIWYPFSKSNASYDYAPVRPSELRALYIGCNASAAFSEEAVALLRQFYSSARVYQAAKREDTYALQYTEV